MSGGSRANVLPLAVNVDADFFTGGSRNALRRVLASWPLDDVRAWLSDDVGIALALEEATGKWFPAANSGRAVRDALLSAATRRGAAVHHRASVEAVRRDGGRWTVTLADGSERSADVLVLATGGLSFPAVGTTGTGHVIAEHTRACPSSRFSRCCLLARAHALCILLPAVGHAVAPPFPALVPLLGAHPGAEHGGANELAGVSLQTVALRCGEGSKAGRAHRGGFLFSHKGFSGPAVLDLSHRVVTAPRDAQPPLLADWTGEGRATWEARLAAPGPQLAASRLSAHLPARLAAALCTAAGVPPDRRAAELRRDERTRLLDALSAFPLHVTGDAGFSKAEVSGGGVPLNELRLDTLESRKAPGVFICGELVDAFGRIGGCVTLWRHAFVHALHSRAFCITGSISFGRGAPGGWRAWARQL